MTKKQKGGAITIRVPTKPNPSTPIKPPPIIRSIPTKAPIVIKPPPVIRPTPTRAPVIMKPTPIRAPIVIKPPPVIRPTPTRAPTLTLPPTPRAPSIPAKFSAPTTLQQKPLPVMPTTTIRSLPLITSTFPMMTTSIGINPQLSNLLSNLGFSYEQLKNTSNLSNGPIDFNKAVKLSTLVIQEGNEALMLITKELASSPSNPLLISTQKAVNTILQTVSVQQAYIKSAIVFNILIEDTQPSKDILLTESINNVRTKINTLVSVANDGLALVRTGLTTSPGDQFLLNAQKSLNQMLDVVKISEAILQFMQDSKKMSELSNSSPLNKDLIVSHATTVIQDANILLNLVKTALASQSEMPSTYIPWLKNIELGCNDTILNIPKWLDSIKGVSVTTTLNSQIDQAIQSAFDSYNKFVDDMKVSSKSLPTTDGMNRLTVQAYNVMRLAVTTEELINTTMVNDSKNVSLIMSRQFIAIILAVMKLMIQILNLGNEMDISGSFRPPIFHQTSITKILDTIPTVNKVIDNALQIIPGHNWIISVKNMIQEIKQSYTTVLSQINETTTLTPQTTSQTTTQTIILTPDEQALIKLALDSYNHFSFELKASLITQPTTADTSKLAAQHNTATLNATAAEKIIMQALANDSKSTIFINYQQIITVILAVLKLMRGLINIYYGVAKSAPISASSIQRELDSIPPVTTVINNAFQTLPEKTWITTVQNIIEDIKKHYTQSLYELNVTTTLNSQTTTQTPLTADEQAIQATFDLYNQFAVDLKLRINSPSNTDATSKLSNQHTILRDNAMVTEVLINKALENDSNNTKFIMYKQTITVILATINFMRHIINQQYWVAKSDKLYASEGVLNLSANRAYVQTVLDNIPSLTTVINNALQTLPGNSFITSVKNTIEEIKDVYTTFLSKLSATTTRISGGRSRKFSSKKRTSTYKKKRTARRK